MRRRLKSLSRPATSSATSMLAAMICSSSSRAPRRVASDAIRLNTLRRGRMAPMTSPSSETQSPTVGKSTWPSAANRNAPDTLADRWPASPRTNDVSRWTATTRPGRRPSAANGAKDVAQLASQPRASSPVDPIATSADPLELAGALGVALGPAERPQPERDEHGTHHDQRPDEVQQLVQRRAVDQPGANALEDVGGRR